MAKSSTKRPPGRPPAGRGGLAVTTTYVQTTLRLEPETKELLDALTRLLGRPQRQVTGEALALYARRLKGSDRELLRGLLRRKD
ncbi:MAG: hypothetical protein CL477_03090 [Acidobacteria bacterium]|jgi:hypothetical protein|nr:hypothetical protein [Acidobacteriota bacterium]|tara:strand:- start:914 stop:1165 length:252 start_codon:yes stop_codon:yes gene_type:complete